MRRPSTLDLERSRPIPTLSLSRSERVYRNLNKMNESDDKKRLSIVRLSKPKDMEAPKPSDFPNNFLHELNAELEKKRQERELRKAVKHEMRELNKNAKIKEEWEAEKEKRWRERN